jgi:hypothetical protein
MLAAASCKGHSRSRKKLQDKHHHVDGKKTKPYEDDPKLEKNSLENIKKLFLVSFKKT